MTKTPNEKEIIESCEYILTYLAQKEWPGYISMNVFSTIIASMCTNKKSLQAHIEIVTEKYNKLQKHKTK
jgi:hypothetical protein